MHIKKKTKKYTHHVLFRVLVRRKQIHSFDMTKIDIIAKRIDLQQLANVLFTIVAGELCAVLELGTNFGKLLVDPLLCLVLGRTCACVKKKKNPAAINQLSQQNITFINAYE